MKHLFILVLTLLLAACASQYRYNPLQNIGIGPYHASIGQNLYRVHFKTLGSNKETTRLQALKHAKYLTSNQNLDWFIVLKEQVITEQLESLEANEVLRITCNENECHQSTYSNPHFKQQFTASDKPVTTEVIVVIRMGRGIQPAVKKSYSAY
ncbi:CC0125/CC1285 family lipoprotein [Kangiella japonica]